MTDRVPGAPGQYKAVVTQEELLKMQAGEQFTITMTRDDQPITEGTPYSKAAVLPDDLAQQLCPDTEDPTPADALAALLPKNEATVLLWENPSPTSEFAAQTVALDLSKYKYIIIVTKWWYGSTSFRPPVIGFVGIGAQSMQFSAGDGMIGREFTPTATGITFGDCSFTAWGGTEETQNQSCLPMKIYGCM